MHSIAYQDVGDDAWLAESSERGLEEAGEHEDGGHDAGDGHDAGHEVGPLADRGGALGAAAVRHRIRLTDRGWISGLRPARPWIRACPRPPSMLPFLPIFAQRTDDRACWGH